MLCLYVKLRISPFPTCAQQGSKPAKKPATSKVSKDTFWLVRAGAMYLYVTLCKYVMKSRLHLLMYQLILCYVTLWHVYIVHSSKLKHTTTKTC